MERYSHLFSTLHDEQTSMGFLGNMHYSILRAVVKVPVEQPTVAAKMAEKQASIAAVAPPGSLTKKIAEKRLAALSLSSTKVMRPAFHDFAVLWDGDHDRRIIWYAEKLFEADLLQQVVFIGECKATVTIYTATPPSDGFEAETQKIASVAPSDNFSCFTELFGSSPLMEGHAAYLEGIRALWQLGPKPLVFTTEHFARF